MRIPMNGSPVIDPEGTIYVAAGKITALYEEDGSGLYAIQPDGRQAWLWRPDLGVCADPLVGPERTIYLHARFRRPAAWGTTIAESVALDAATGDVRHPLAISVRAHSPIMDRHGIFYCFVDRDMQDLVAVTGEDREVWRHVDLGYPIEEPHVIGADGTVYVCAVTANNHVFLYALGASGETRWQRQLTVPARLAISHEDLLLVWHYDGVVQALSADGTMRWQRLCGRSPGLDAAGPAFGPKDTVYLVDRQHLVVLDATGTIRWQRPLAGPLSDGPAVAADGACYLGGTDHYLTAFWPDGSERWRFRTGGEIHSVPAIHPDGTLYVGSDDGSLYALSSDGDELWRFGTTIERGSTYLDDRPPGASSAAGAN